MDNGLLRVIIYLNLFHIYIFFTPFSNYGANMVADDMILTFRRAGKLQDRRLININFIRIAL